MNVTKTWRHPWLRFFAAVAVSVVAGSGAWLLVTRTNSETETSVPVMVRAPAEPSSVVLTQTQLQTLAVSWRGPVYWAGARPGSAYEVTRHDGGSAYVRYLPEGVAAGTGRSDYLTVATYPLADAFARLRAVAHRSGSVAVSAPGGGLVVYARSRPTNVYLAYPGASEQVEIYDPSGSEALRLTRSGRIRPVTGLRTQTGGAPRAVSVSSLRALVATQGAPVYWAGTRPNTVYELTETGDGRTYLRYLDGPRQVGSSRASFLTVATYQDADAFRHVQAASRRPGAVLSRLEDGGLAVYDSTHPTSVYLAYPGAVVQVEIYDPSAAEAKRLVKEGRIRPVG